MHDAFAVTIPWVEDLMLLARADANVEDLALEPVGLAALAQTACAEARVLAEAAGITLTNGGLSQCTVSETIALCAGFCSSCWIMRSSIRSPAARCRCLWGFVSVATGGPPC